MSGVKLFRGKKYGTFALRRYEKYSSKKRIAKVKSWLTKKKIDIIELYGAEKCIVGIFELFKKIT